MTSAHKHFCATYDPFGFETAWMTLANSEFREDFGNLVSMNLALHPRNSELTISLDDLSVQSMLCSYAEDIGAQRRVQEIVGGIARSDITSFPELFGAYAAQQPSFRSSMVFAISWFAQLGRKYAKNGLEGFEDRFPDFRQLYDGPHTYARVMQEIEQSNDQLILDFHMNYFFNSSIRMDFARECIEFETQDMLLTPPAGKYYLLSERLEQDNPYLRAQDLSFAIPTGYREQWFPLLNVQRIILHPMGGGNIIEYSAVPR